MTDDVRSLGVILLELLSGRRAVDPNRGHPHQDLVAWVGVLAVCPHSTLIHDCTVACLLDHGRVLLAFVTFTERRQWQLWDAWQR